jgi:uncharacterized protein (TIGR02466 family)
MAVIRDLNLFPVLVRRIDEFLAQTECAEIVSKLDAGAFGPHGALTGNATSSFDHGFKEARHALDEVEEVVKVKDRISYLINVYARDFGMRPIRLGNSWVNIQREGSGLDYHTHPLSIVSGVLYLKVDEASSKTTFCNPNPFIDVTVIHQPTSYTTRTASLQPTVGTLLLFPSWLRHGSIDRNESAERVVLSFNTRPESNPGC